MLLPKRINKKKQVTIDYEEIVAAGLLKFRELDILDISMLLDEFSKIKNVNTKYVGYYSELNFCQQFLEESKGGIRVKENVSFDDPFSKKENPYSKTQMKITKATTVREALTLLTNDFVLDFVNKMDIVEFKSKKEGIIKEQTKKILENGNILLISDQEEEYKALKEYGFKNIDWFKSYVRADRYFLNATPELDKYHIIIEGNQKIFSSSWDNPLWLKKYIKELEDNKEVISSSISVYEALQKVSLYTKDLKINNYHGIESVDFKSTLDCLAMIAIASEIMNKKMPKKEYGSIGIYENVNQNQTVFPKKKEDLKILFLVPYLNDDSVEIARKLGLNIDFLDDNNYTFKSRVYNQLGDYDIIIGSEMYSQRIAYCSMESTEQCKDRGRKQTLLLTYRDNDDRWNKSNRIDLRYSFGGEQATTDVQSCTYNQLIPDYDSIPYEDRYRVMGEYAKTSILEEAVSLYNEKLLEINNEGITDLDFKRANEYQEEYDQFREQKRKEEQEEYERKQEEMKPIHQYDFIYSQISRYLDFKNSDRIFHEPEDIEIKITEQGIQIKSLFGDKVLSAITISKTGPLKEYDFRIFSVATLSSKGKLSKPEIVSVHTSEWDDKEGIPKRPNEAQQKAMDALEKKVNAVIKPLNEKVAKNPRGRKQNIKRRNDQLTFAKYYARFIDTTK